jgi:hypothetical protein
MGKLATASSMRCVGQAAWRGFQNGGNIATSADAQRHLPPLMPKP